MCFGIPLSGFAKAVGETVWAPDPVSQVIVEMSQRLHTVFRRIGKGRKGCRRLNDTPVVLRAMGHVTFIAVACRKSPTVGAIALEVFWIGDTIGPVDERMIAGLFGVIDAFVVLEVGGIDPHKAVLLEKEWSAVVEISQWEFDAVVFFPVQPGG